MFPSETQLQTLLLSVEGKGLLGELPELEVGVVFDLASICVNDLEMARQYMYTCTVYILSFMCYCTKLMHNVVCAYMLFMAHVCTCMISYRDKANASNDTRRQLFFFPREKEEVPRAGLEPAMFCVLGRCCTS